MADRYFVNGGVDNNWGTTGNWSTTSGGAGGETVPSASDDVYFDANSPNCTVNSSTRSAKTLNFTGYTNTITLSVNLNCAGNCTLDAGMGVAGTGILTITTTATITNNGKVWPNTLSLNGGTVTLADNWTNSGLVQANGSPVTINSNELICNGGFSHSVSVSGTAKLVFGGGTITGHTTNPIANPIDFAGDLTFPNAGTLTLSAGTYTYVSGSMTFSGTHTLRLTGAATLDLEGIVWKSLITAAGSSTTWTLTSNLTADTLITLGSGSLAFTFDGSAIEAPANLRFGMSSGLVAGTTEIIMTGTGTLDAPSLTTGVITSPLIIDTTGDITLADPTPRTNLGKFVVRNAGSITTIEEWNLGSGAASLNPLTSIFGKV